MYLPRLSTSERKHQKQNIQFGGLDRTQAYSEGALSDAVGVSARQWPCLTARTGRTRTREAADCSALFAWGKLIRVEGAQLFCGDDSVGAVEPGKKQFAVVNTKLCIFPDKKYLDLTTKEFGDLEARAQLVENTVTFTKDALEVTSLRRVMGKRYQCMNVTSFSDDHKTLKVKRYREENISWSAEGGWFLTGMEEVMPESLKVGDCVMLPKSSTRGDRWIDHTRKTYNGKLTPYATEYDSWGDYAYVLGVDSWADTTHVGVTVFAERRNAGASNVTFTDRGFKAGDAVTLSGCVTHKENDRSILVKEVTGTRLVFDSPVFQEGAEAGTVTVRRIVPDLDFICESGNRLWGVSNKDKTIYASALGDPTNFYIYDGVAVGNSMLSYAVPVGTDGDFTAICAYGSNVLCWKEQCLHKVLGTLPANYEVFTYQIAGVQAGSEESLEIVNEVLYYKGREGVYAYTGSTPKLVSAKLGLTDYGEAAAGHVGRNYLISMKRADTGTWETLSFGTDTGLWLKESEEKTLAFANLDGVLYSLTPEGIFCHSGEADGAEGKPIPWSATFAPFTETVHNKKGYSRLLLRLELEEGAWAEVDVAEDNGSFQTVWTAHAPGPVTQVVPIRPGRCDSFQVRLRGEGRFLLQSMVREFTVGSVW